MASTYSRDRHDIGLVHQNGTNVGIMLLHKNNVPVYAEYDEEYLASQFFSGVAGYASLPSERELAIRQDSWRAGFGLDIYDSDEPERYYNSRGMDMRFRSRAIAGMSPTNSSPSISYPTVNLADGGLENWVSETNLNDWTEQLASSGALYRSTTNTHAGTNSARLYLTGAADKAGVSQLISWNRAFQGSPVVVNAWVQSAGGISACNIEVSDGIGRTVAQLVSNTSYQLLTVNHVIDGAANQLNIHIGANGSVLTTNAYVDDITIAYIPYKVIRDMADFNDKLYFASGKHLVRMDAVNGAFTVVNVGFPANITSLEPFTDDSLYVGCNTGALYSAINTAEGKVTAGAGVNTFQFLKTVHSATPTMWGNDGANVIRSTATPNNALTWSGQTNVGSSYHNITDLLTRSAALYIMKEDMPYYLNSSGAVQTDLAPKLVALTSPTSGKNAYTDGDKIWIPAGAQSLLEEDSGTLVWRTPSLFSTDIADYSGRVAALASDDMYLYAIINGTGVCHVLAGRNETIGSSTQWVWHPIAEVPIAACETAYVSSVYKKRLWIASNTGTLFYLPLYEDYGNPTGDTNRSFASNVEVQTPWLHANFKDTVKAYPRVTALLGHAYNANVFFNCHYKTLENTSWTQLSDLVGNSSTREATSYFPTNTFSNMVRLKFVVNSAYTDITPILLGYNVQGLLYPPRRKTYAMSIKVSDSVLLKNGITDAGSKQATLNVLDEIRDNKWPVVFYDINGDPHNTRVLPLPSGTPKMGFMSIEKERTSELIYNLLLQDIDLG